MSYERAAPITLSEAIQQGLTIYTSGRICKRGHAPPRRYVQTYQCVDCNTENAREHRTKQLRVVAGSRAGLVPLRAMRVPPEHEQHIYSMVMAELDRLGVHRAHNTPTAHERARQAGRTRRNAAVGSEAPSLRPEHAPVDLMARDYGPHDPTLPDPRTIFGPPYPKGQPPIKGVTDETGTFTAQQAMSPRLAAAPGATHDIFGHPINPVLPDDSRIF